MPGRRILSLWFPRLAAERYLRLAPILGEHPFAVVGEEANQQILTSLSQPAEAAGLRLGQGLRDATATCPQLVTREAKPELDALFLSALRRRAGRFSPWVGESPPDGLVIDITGVAHLFGSEERLRQEAEEEARAIGLSVQSAIADTVGGAWALCRFSGRDPVPDIQGDAIDQEARATRSRAAKKRRWEKGGTAPAVPRPDAPPVRIAEPGRNWVALAPLPIAALRVPEKIVSSLARVGLRRIGDLIDMPRAPLARRYGRGLVERLEQALGGRPEPVSPVAPDNSFAVRLTLPDPIGLEADILAAIDRLLPRLCEALARTGRGARRVRLEAHRADHGLSRIEIGLARASAEAERIRPLLQMKLGEIEAGFGIDVVRLVASQTEPVAVRQVSGFTDPAEATALDDLIGRLGSRLGLEAVTRLVPAESNIPEKTATELSAAWSEPAADWPAPRRPRPLILFRPEPVSAPVTPAVPARIRWRRRALDVASATGPERIAPEWWLDDPDWRTGTRDYWRVEMTTGERLWLCYAHGGALSPGWFCHGIFA